MSRKIILFLSSIILAILFFFLLSFKNNAQAQEPPPLEPPPAAPQSTSVVITPIGDLKPDDAKQITISGLDNNTNYALVEEKKTCSVACFGGDYTRFFTMCFNSGSNGQIVTDLGPYRTPGLYRLKVYKADTRASGCVPSNQVASQDFSVGGPTGQACCTLPLAVYDRDKDVCKKDLFTSPDKTNSGPTACANSGTFCEPESLQCFKTKTGMVGGKICKESKDEPGFDPNKDVVCGSSKGQQIPGCNDPKDPKYDPDNPAIATAIGCIHTNPTEFIKDLMKFVVGISGGLAFLMMLLGAFQMLTSAGNPETLSAGRDRLTSAVIGLLFVIFAILLLQIIGVGILNIPGFK